MATIDLSITISVADQARAVAAYQIDANADLNGTASGAQVLTYIKKVIRTQITARVVASELAAAQAAVSQPVPPVLT